MRHLFCIVSFPNRVLTADSRGGTSPERALPVTSFLIYKLTHNTYYSVLRYTSTLYTSGMYSSDSENESDFDIDTDILSGIQAYQFEPKFNVEELKKNGCITTSADEDETTDEKSSELEQVERRGNTLWCSCSNCKAMPTDAW